MALSAVQRPLPGLIKSPGLDQDKGVKKNENTQELKIRALFKNTAGTTFEQRIQKHVELAKGLSQEDVLNIYKEYPALGARVLAELFKSDTVNVQKKFVVKNEESYKKFDEMHKTALAKQKAEIKLEPTTTKAVVSSKSSSLQNDKDAYLSGVRSSAMLGYQEAKVFANILNRPIVVVRNSVVTSVFLPESSDGAKMKPVYVKNDFNVHFDGLQVSDRRRPIAGESINGIIRSASGEGNNCFINALKTDAEAATVLESMGSNSKIRMTVAAIQESNVDANFYTRETDVSTAADAVRNIRSLSEVTQGRFRVRITAENSFEEGFVSNGVKTGQWIKSNEQGMYEEKYTQSVMVSVQTHIRHSNGKLSVIE